MKTKYLVEDLDGNRFIGIEKSNEKILSKLDLYELPEGPFESKEVLMGTVTTNQNLSCDLVHRNRKLISNMPLYELIEVYQLLGAALRTQDDGSHKLRVQKLSKIRYKRRFKRQV